MNTMLEQLIPRAHQMGVEFVEMRPGYVRAEVPFEGNGNHFGVIYAGVTFTLCEVLGGAMHFATFDVSTHYPLVRNLEIDFVAPGNGRLSHRLRCPTPRSRASGPRPPLTRRSHSCSKPRSWVRTKRWSRAPVATTRFGRSGADEPGPGMIIT